MYKKTIFFLALLLILPNLALADNLADRLSGKILLQVEDNGEAWYVYPQNQNRYFLGRPADAFELMRKLGLGVSNKDFASWNGLAPLRLAGMILLKVEDNGEAYYVNPDNQKMLFMGRPSDAFKLMREQGLGISNLNLGQIVKAQNQIKHQEQKSENPPSESDDTSNSKEMNNEDSSSEADSDSEESSEEEVATSTEDSQETSEDTASSSEETAGQDENSEESLAADSSQACEFSADFYTNESIGNFPNYATTTMGLNFDWGTNAPEGIGNYFDHFSARFQGDCWFEEGKYRFTATYNDGIEATVENFWIVNSWKDTSVTKTASTEINLEEGYHEVKVDYYDNILDAVIKLDWEKIE